MVVRSDGLVGCVGRVREGSDVAAREQRGQNGQLRGKREEREGTREITNQIEREKRPKRPMIQEDAVVVIGEKERRGRSGQKGKMEFLNVEVRWRKGRRRSAHLSSDFASAIAFFLAVRRISHLENDDAEGRSSARRYLSEK